jgi:hypothetical protein
MSILMYLCQNFGCGVTLLNRSFRSGFTAIKDQPRVGEVLPGCGPQSSVAPFNIPISFWSRAMQSARGGGFSVRPALAFFLSGQLVLHHSRQIPETIALYCTPRKYLGR